MKKLSLLLLLPFLLFMSCEDSKKMTINGTVTDGELNGKKLYMLTMQADSLMAKGPILADSAEIKDGKFTFNTVLPQNAPILGLIGTSKNSREAANSNFANVFIALEPGIVNLTLDKNRITMGGTAINDSLNNLFYTYTNKLLDINDEAQKAQGIMAIPLDKDGNDGARQLKVLSRNLKKGLYKFVKGNMDNGVGEAMFLNIGTSFSKDQLSELLALSDTSFQNNEQIKELKEALDMQKEKESGIIGKPFDDLKLTNVNGSQDLLSNYAGKGSYTYLYFWNMQSEDSLELMTELLYIADGYKDNKNILLVGISLDRDINVWKQALGMGLPGVQLYDAGFASPSVYDFDMVPYSFFLDRDGKILSINLSPDELEDKLEDLVK